MRTVITTVIVSLLFLTAAHAQTPAPVVPLSRAKLTWEWTQGSGGPVEKFQIFCKTLARPDPVVTTVVSAAARECPLSSVVSEPGTYTCWIIAVNDVGPSGNSNEVNFKAGHYPKAPTVFTVTK